VKSADGVEIRYDVRGAGSPAVVFVHCWTCNRRFWDDVAARLSSRYRVMALDLAGHGESGRNRARWTMEAYGADVAAVVEALGLDRVVLVGHSMGGSVMLEAAPLLSKRVLGLVPVDTLQSVEYRLPPEQLRSIVEGFRADYQAAAESFMRERLFVPSTTGAVKDRVIGAARSAAPDIAIASLEAVLTYDAAAAFDRTRIPIHAINTDLFPTDLEANRRHAPQFQVTVMKGVGHYPMLEDAERFGTLLEETLRTLGGQVLK
jgi:pimeloyl-ACP methyl ester carboxylesterase